MKLTVENENYSAIVIKVNHLNELEGAKTLAGLPALGLQALVSKDTEIGTLGVFFPTECQLSGDFCHNNNLYRDQEKNIDTNKKGFFEDKRRVKAIKLAGHVSNAFFTDLSSLAYLGINPNELKEGDTFTHINGIEVCCKYVVKQPQSKSNKTRGLKKRFVRVDNKLFPEHWDTDQYFRNVHIYKDNDWITVTQKIHGTSGRFANTKVRKLSKTETFLQTLDGKLLHFLNSKSRIKRLRKAKKWLHDKYFYTISSNISKMFKTQYEYDTIAGSRRVVKDLKSEKVNEDYYDCDIWNQHLDKIRHVIPKNWVIYGEIVGWVNNDKAIQKNYCYLLPKGTSKLYVYRISIVNEDGIVQDLSWQQIKEWCVNNGINHVPELYSGYHNGFHTEDFIDRRYNEIGYSQALPLIKKKGVVDEGVCIRKEGLKPYVTKLKGPVFYEHESKDLDSGNVDIESAENEN